MMSLAMTILWILPIIGNPFYYPYIPRMEQELIQRFMGMAYNEALEAFDRDEVPVGAVVVHENKIIGRGHNRTIELHDATAHAEIIALSAAFEYFKDWRLEKAWLFCTLEPCVMCAGAAMLSRIETIVYGAPDPKFGSCGSILDIPKEKRFNHRIEVINGVMEEEIATLMKDFFRKVRANKEQIH